MGILKKKQIPLVNCIYLVFLSHSMLRSQLGKAAQAIEKGKLKKYENEMHKLNRDPYRTFCPRNLWKIRTTYASNLHRTNCSSNADDSSNIFAATV